MDTFNYFQLLPTTSELEEGGASSVQGAGLMGQFRVQILLYSHQENSLETLCLGIDMFS